MSKRAYTKMLKAYQENESAYWNWAKERKLFAQNSLERKYYRKGINRERRKKLAEWVLADFPKASWRDVCCQTGGCREIIWEFGFWETPHDPYWCDEIGLFEVFLRLKHCPDEIYDAIENTYEWSKEVHVRTTLVEKHIVKILNDIGAGRVW